MSIIIPGRPGQIVGSVVGFFVGPWGKIAGIAILCGFLLWQGRLWLNRHDDRIAAQATQKTIDRLEVQYVASWQQKLTEAKAMTDEASVKLEVAEALSKRIDARFAIVINSLGRISEDVKKRDVIYVERANTIPASELDGALRVLSDAIQRQFPLAIR